MKQLVCLVVLLVAGSVSWAQDACCSYKVAWVDQAVTCCRMEWRTRDVPCEVMKPVYREETRTVQREVTVPEWRDETREVVTHSYKPREVVREVCRYVLVPCTAVDPCTGCAVTTCKPQVVVDKVKCTVYDCVPEVTKVPVKVCHYRREMRDFKETLIHCDWKKETVVRKEAYCVPVTYTTTMKVPVLVPCCP